VGVDMKKPEYEASIFAEVGRKAAHRAQRELLLRTLIANDWNLTHAGVALRMGGSMHVLRAIRKVGLIDEYETARSQGKLSPGRYGIGRRGAPPCLSYQDRRHINARDGQ